MINEIDSELGAIIKKHCEIYNVQDTIPHELLSYAENPEELKKNCKERLINIIKKGLSEIKGIDIKENPTSDGINIYGEVIVFQKDNLIEFINDIMAYIEGNINEINT